MTAALRYLHRSDWTVHDLADLPDDGYRYEIIDGDLIVSPPPSPRHQMILRDLTGIVMSRLPQGLDCLEGVGVLAPQLGLERFVIPDMVIFHGVLPERYLEPEAVVVAVEVVSPTSTSRDRHWKRGLYADLGIEEYWLVEPDRRRLTLLQLSAGEYVEKDQPFDQPPGHHVLSGLSLDTLFAPEV